MASRLRLRARTSTSSFCLVPRAQVSAGDHLALPDENHFVARDLDFAQQMRIEKYRGAALPLGAQNVAHQPTPHRAEPGGRLVEEDQLWLVNQRLRQPNALQHAC
jgi:hypothetical protein